MFYVILVSKCTFQNMIWLKCFSVCADMFLQHLDTELVEEDVQKITSGSKAKAQIMVLTAQITSFFFFMCVFSIFFFHLTISAFSHI